jgi:5-enolpyruvylshikimate-3-phosphate synthase
MAMAILALHSQNPIQINNTACIATSYPQFTEDLQKITTP